MEQAEVLADSGDLEPGGGRKKRFNGYAHILPVHSMEREPVGIFACQLPVRAHTVCACVRARLPCVCIFILPACMRPPARSAVCDGASALVTAVVVYLCSAYKFISFPFNTAPPDPRSRRRQQQQQLCYHGDRGRKED